MEREMGALQQDFKAVEASYGDDVLHLVIASGYLAKLVNNPEIDDERLVGGVGLRRGRRDPEVVRIGDAIDFWRVEAVEPDKRLLLRAEMKLPGRAWLQFETHSHSSEQTRLVQATFFAPKGLFGLAYWYLLYPIHRLIFAGMIRNLAQRAMEITIKGKYE
jgi:hypothetical protein